VDKGEGEKNPEREEEKGSRDVAPGPSSWCLKKNTKRRGGVYHLTTRKSKRRGNCSREKEARLRQTGVPRHRGEACSPPVVQKGVTSQKVLGAGIIGGGKGRRCSEEKSCLKHRKSNRVIPLIRSGKTEKRPVGNKEEGGAKSNGKQSPNRMS